MPAMRKILLTAVLLGVMVLMMPAARSLAAADATCTSDPAVGATGTVFTVLCSGFDANVMVTAYTVEPDGAAVACFGQRLACTGGQRTDAHGNFSLTMASAHEPIFTLASGTWTLVVEEIGPGLAVIHRGETSFRIMGGTEGVSGASLVITPSQGEKGVTRAVMYGSGFLPGESVTIWAENPKGDCSSYTIHTFLNFTIERGVGAGIVNTRKADGAGNMSYPVLTDNFEFCEGTYHFVARGNTSGRGGDAFYTLVGSRVTESARLTVSPTAAEAFGAVLTFSGTGYGSAEHVTCWLTTPEGQVSVIQSIGDGFGIKAGASGGFAFPLLTGGQVDPFQIGNVLGSEGALGEWAMTCRGDSSGLTGIARFRLTGGTVDP